MSAYALTATGWKRINRLNKSSSAKRQISGRMGRGEDAFTPKEAKWAKQVEGRIEAIVQRCGAAGCAGPSSSRVE